MLQGGFNFLMAAVFISAFLLVVTMNIMNWFFDGNKQLVLIDWLIFISLSTIRLTCNIIWEKGKSHRLP